MEPQTQVSQLSYITVSLWSREEADQWPWWPDPWVLEERAGWAASDPRKFTEAGRLVKDWQTRNWGSERRIVVDQGGSQCTYEVKPPGTT